MEKCPKVNKVVHLAEGSLLLFFNIPRCIVGTVNKQAQAEEGVEPQRSASTQRDVWYSVLEAQAPRAESL